MTSRTWPSSHSPNNELSTRDEDSFNVVTLNELQQGELYIVKIKLVTIALFQGWQDETCCFYILRTDLSDPTRWSEAKYLPNNFDAYPAFDRAGNPSIQLWTQQLKSSIPPNWFSLFEEAKMIQSQWHGYEPHAIDASYGIPLADREALLTRQLYSDGDQIKEQNYNENLIAEAPKTVVDSISKNQEKTEEIAQKPNQIYSPEAEASCIQLKTKSEGSNMPMKDTYPNQEMSPRSSSLPDDKIAQRKSWSSFFLKKKKSKKSLREKRDSVPPNTYPTLAERTEIKERYTTTTDTDEGIRVKKTSSAPKIAETPLLNFQPQGAGETDTFMDFRLALAFLDSTNIDTTNDLGQQKISA